MSRALPIVIVTALGCVLTAFLGAVVWLGWPYYSLPRADRADHALHVLLAPGAPLGLWLGVAGTAMMSFILLYSVRKALVRVTWLGRLDTWLRFHILAGVMGPLYIVVHAGLTLPEGLIAVGFWCMIAVGLSGGFGRYVYGLFPRMSSGRALQWDEALATLADLRAELVAATAGADGAEVGAAVAVVSGFSHEAAGLAQLPGLQREVWRRRRRIASHLGSAGLDPATRIRAQQMLDQQLSLKRGLEASRVAHRLFSLWHLFHRPLASAMYVIVLWHVGFALLFGGSLGVLWGAGRMIYYAISVLLIVVVFVWPSWRAYRREEAEAKRLLEAAMADGRHEPVTIRPWVDEARCMGSGSCVAACPEGDVLQVIEGTARLVHGSQCVGHGACEAACPVGAITLKFGSERRGVDLPAVGPDFQSNVPGLYIAGELGGMGLIANAARQGAQAIEHIAQGLRPAPEGGIDVLIVGAGPAGIAASLTAKARGLSHLVLEQDTFGGSVLHFPRAKIVMTHGMQLPGQARVKAGSMTKEELVALLCEVVEREVLPIREQARCVSVEGEDGCFQVEVGDDEVIKASRVLLAVGRRGTPRTLGVPGEELPKVAYRMVDPELVHHEHVLVVGGGDSALEAAIALAEQPGNRVTLSYRGEVINRPKTKNRDKLEAAVQAGTITKILSSNVTAIAPDRVRLDTPDGEEVVPNDRVYVFAGGVLPTAFLAKAGVALERHHGDRVVRLDA